MAREEPVAVADPQKRSTLSLTVQKPHPEVYADVSSTGMDEAVLQLLDQLREWASESHESHPAILSLQSSNLYADIESKHTSGMREQRLHHRPPLHTPFQPRLRARA